MRTILVLLFGLVVSLSGTLAAPAPLPRRTPDLSPEQEARVKEELARVRKEYYQVDVLLLRVRRGEQRDEWVVTYKYPADACESGGFRGFYDKEVRVSAAEAWQFNGALRAALARRLEK